MTDDKENIPDAEGRHPPRRERQSLSMLLLRRRISPPLPRRSPQGQGKQANKAKDAAKPRRPPVRMTRRPPTRPSRSFGTRTVNMAAFGGVPIPLYRSVCVCLHLAAEHQALSARDRKQKQPSSIVEHRPARTMTEVSKRVRSQFSVKSRPSLSNRRSSRPHFLRCGNIHKNKSRLSPDR